MAVGRRRVEASRSEPASCLSPLRTGHKLPFDHRQLQLCQGLVNKLTRFWEGGAGSLKMAFQILVDLSCLVHGQ